MLSRTAESLFWMSRYVERAECIARLLDATYRLVSLPHAQGAASNEWESALLTAGNANLFHETHDLADEANVIQFLAFAPDNPSSIRNCFETARANARSVRTALTTEMWDAINGAWHELRRFQERGMDREAITRFLEFVKEASIRIDGSGYRTMLRNDAYWFARLGVLIERADATARILDVKYHVLLPQEDSVGGALDFFQWTSILRSVSAFTSYHWVYRDNVKPWLVADLLILNCQMPRSLACCYQDITVCLDDLAAFYGAAGPAQERAREIRADLGAVKIEQIFQSGLHEFVTRFIGRNAALSSAVTAQYLV
jgi:uncharacterized alpha-E superfamily protein